MRSLLITPSSPEGGTGPRSLLITPSSRGRSHARSIWLGAGVGVGVGLGLGLGIGLGLGLAHPGPLHVSHAELHGIQVSSSGLASGSLALAYSPGLQVVSKQPGGGGAGGGDMGGGAGGGQDFSCTPFMPG